MSIRGYEKKSGSKIIFFHEEILILKFGLGIFSAFTEPIGNDRGSSSIAVPPLLFQRIDSNWLSKLIKTSVSKDKPIIVLNKNNEKIGVITQSDLLKAVVEGNEGE